MPKILVIDDEELVCKALRRHLTMDGHAIFVAENGHTGLKILKKEDIDIVLTELNMPKMDGIEVLRHIKKLSPKTEVIIIAAHGNMKTVLESFKAGAFDFITKPINYEELRLSIRRALEKQAQESLGEEKDPQIKTMERLHRTLYDNAPVLLFVIDTSGKILDVNKRVENVLGYHAKDLLEKHISLIIKKNHRVAFRDFMRERFNRAAPAAGIELEILNKRGNPILTNLELTPVSDSNWGTVALVHLSDATERSALLQQLIQSERLKAVGEMASGIAHNINNILTIVLGHIRLIQSRPEDKQVLQDAIKIISKSAWDGAQLVRKLQSFSRVHRPLERLVPVDINYIVRESIEFTKLRWKDEAQFHGVHYNIKCHSLTGAVLVPGNASELREVFVNIINNAIDAMPEGGELSFSTKLNGNKVLVSVADSGCGINEKHCKKLFEPFFTTKYGKGTGLGLSTVLAVLTEHKGTIKVKSVVGKGSKFIIKLPVLSSQGRDTMFATANLPQARHCAPTIPIDGTKAANVLVIDDEEGICNIIAKFLRSTGHSVSTALTGKEGIRIFKSGQFDLVLCDLTMPDMSGWEVARAIHNLESQRVHKTPIVIFTGWGDTFDPAMLAKTGVKMVISKPLDNNQLLDMVGKAAFKRLLS
ncbi:MAG: response regulator [Planctomycetes bacterium]|nr:response regulator [Planctomycetota bacterium]